MNKRIGQLCLTLAVSQATWVYAAVVYVDCHAPAGGNGQSWATAFNTIQGAITCPHGGYEIWVAAGTYYEHISLAFGRDVYGGFVGNETLLEQRDWVANPTIIDGGGSGDVVTSGREATPCRLDGFTIRNGSRGIYCYYSSPVICNNVITGNAAYDGAGICCINASATIRNNIIIDNEAASASTWYGAISCSASSPMIDGNKIHSNRAHGIFICSGSPTITNNSIAGNTRVGISAGSDSTPTIANNHIAFNSNGGVFCTAATIRNNVITANRGSGGGVCCGSSSVVIGNTIVANSSQTGGGIYCLYPSSMLIANNIVAWNSSGIQSSTGTCSVRNNCVYNPNGKNFDGVTPGAGNITVDPLLVSTLLGDVHIAEGSPCINAGDNSIVQTGWTDIDGEARLQNGQVDIGADEFNGATPPLAPVIVRVSPSGNDANDGSTWNLAKRTIQSAVDANPVSPHEVWVAAGTYTERLTVNTWAHLYGGFAGTETSRDQRNPRTNTTTIDGNAGGSVITVLSPGFRTNTIDGFVLRNGTGTVYSTGIYGGGIYCSDSSPIISNDLIIGNSAFRGGGIFASGDRTWALISNNTIAGNIADHEGGGIFTYSPLTISNNVIVGNTAATNGGGLGSYNAALSVVSNTFTCNYADIGGGGLYCEYASAGLISNNIVAWNSSGIYSNGPVPLRNNCVYNPDYYNYSSKLTAGPGDISVDPKLVASEYGEAHLKAGSPCISAGDPTSVQSSWVDMDGQPRTQGGRVDIGADEFDGTTPSFTPRAIRVSPSGNDSNAGGTWASAKRTVQSAINEVAYSGGEVWVAAGTYSGGIRLKSLVHVYGGFAGGESVRSERRDPMAHATVIDGCASGSVVTALNAGHHCCTIDGFTIQNGTGTTSGSYGYRYGGGIYCFYASPVISGNVISGNTAYGGGGICARGPKTLILNNIISNNTATEIGGGVLSWSNSIVINNKITNNSAPKGGGIGCASHGSLTIVSNTIASNIATTSGGGLYLQSSDPAISNNVVAFNSSGLSKINGLATLRNNCVYNPGGAEYSGLTAGTGDFSRNPLFVNLGAGDLRLQTDSPCIDAGYNAALPSWIVNDLAGKTRFVDYAPTPDCRWAPGTCGTAPVVDIGAYEFRSSVPGDLDGDGDVDHLDLDVFVSCASGPGMQPTANCIDADLDQDVDVDTCDFGFLQRWFGTSN